MSASIGGLGSSAIRRPAGASSVLRELAAFVAERLQRRTVRNELSLLTDRELEDIGLVRSDVPHVFEAGFVTGRNRF